MATNRGSSREQQESKGLLAKMLAAVKTNIDMASRQAAHTQLWSRQNLGMGLYARTNITAQLDHMEQDVDRMNTLAGRVTAGIGQAMGELRGLFSIQAFPGGAALAGLIAAAADFQNDLRQIATTITDIDSEKFKELAHATLFLQTQMNVSNDTAAELTTTLAGLGHATGVHVDKNFKDMLRTAGRLTNALGLSGKEAAELTHNLMSMGVSVRGVEKVAGAALDASHKLGLLHDELQEIMKDTAEFMALTATTGDQSAEMISRGFSEVTALYHQLGIDAKFATEWLKKSSDVMNSEAIQQLGNIANLTNQSFTALQTRMMSGEFLPVMQDRLKAVGELLRQANIDFSQGLNSEKNYIRMNYYWQQAQDYIGAAREESMGLAGDIKQAYDLTDASLSTQERFNLALEKTLKLQYQKASAEKAFNDAVKSYQGTFHGIMEAIKNIGHAIMILVGEPLLDVVLAALKLISEPLRFIVGKIQEIPALLKAVQYAAAGVAAYFGAAALKDIALGVAAFAARLFGLGGAMTGVATATTAAATAQQALNVAQQVGQTTAQARMEALRTGGLTVAQQRMAKMSTVGSWTAATTAATAGPITSVSKIGAFFTKIGGIAKNAFKWLLVGGGPIGWVVRIALVVIPLFIWLERKFKFFSTMWDALTESLKGVFEPLVAAFKALWDSLASLGKEILRLFGVDSATSEGMKDITEAAKTFGKVLGFVLKLVIIPIVEILRAGVVVITFIVDLVTMLLKGVNAVSDVFIGIHDWMVKIGNIIIDSFLHPFEAVKNYVTYIWDTIKSMADWFAHPLRKTKELIYSATGGRYGTPPSGTTVQPGIMHAPTLPTPAAPAPTNNAIYDTIAKQAAQAGVNPNTMMKFAKVESNFNPNARASTSSATGLFQFTRDTWAGMVSKYGAEARAQGITDLNPTNPVANAFMAARFTKENQQALQSNLGRQITDTDLYAAHFLGIGGRKAPGATQFLQANPNTIAADLLPAAAKSNPSIFYDKGRPRTVGEVYAWMQNKMEGEGMKKTLASIEGLRQSEATRAAGVTPTITVPENTQLNDLLVTMHTDQKYKKEFMQSMNMRLSQNPDTASLINMVTEGMT